MASHHRPAKPWSDVSLLQWLALVALVGLLSYFAPHFAGLLMLQPQEAWPIWPGCALLVSVLVLVPRKTWLILVPVAFAAFILYDVQAGVSPQSIAWFMLADLVEVVVATAALRFFFPPRPQLNSVLSLTKYLLSAVVLAPAAAAFLSARGIGGGYWTGWRICFFSEVLAFLTLTPAVLSVAGGWRVWLQKSRRYQLEALALVAALGVLGYFAFAWSHERSLLALPFALVPLMLWAALRFGLPGTSVALVVIAFLSIWGAVHGRGPFVERKPLSDLFSIQLFLIFTATPFMVLGALAEERARAHGALRKREDELLEAQRVSQVGSWQWNPQTDEAFWSKEIYRIAGRNPELPPPNYVEQVRLYTPESWARLTPAVEEALRSGTSYKLDLEIVRPDGTKRWIVDRGEVLRDASGKIEWLRGTAQDITERKRAEEALRESEEKFRSVFRNTGIGMVIVSLDGSYLAVNEAFCEYLGYSEEELLQKNVEEITMPEDWPAFSEKLKAMVERGGSIYKLEKRCFHKDGHVIVTESSTTLIRGPQGEPYYFVAGVLDVTKRKQAEAALSNVNRSLIEAHEEERTWIARELHDDISQRIALLSVSLDIALQEARESVVSRRYLHQIQRGLADLAANIHALSHRLHSSKLEYLGLAAASDGFCKEFSEWQKVEIDFNAENLHEPLSKEISLCLFRVLQEALQNAAKHSGVRHFSVSLKGSANEIRLSVSDSGVGFDSESASRSPGLGLTSMRERLRLAGGQLLVVSQPQQGTTIHARVPLKSTAKSAVAG